MFLEAADVVAWGKGHHWNIMKGRVEVKLPNGLDALTLNVV